MDICIDVLSSIDETAKIHPTARSGDNVSIGPWVYIGEHVTIGDGSRIDTHAVVLRNTIIGKNNHIHAHAVVGSDPQDLGYCGEETWLKMGDNNIVREFATISRGSAKSGVTTIGNKNCFMNYAHVGHDCHIGNEVLFVNYAGIAGHVTIDDFAIMGGYSAAHQFTRIGSYSFVVHGSQVGKDVPPFMLVRGTPGIPFALNLVGLRRRGFSTETMRGLKKAFQLMYRQSLSLQELEVALTALASETPQVQMILDVMKTSRRGIIRKQDVSDQE